MTIMKKDIRRLAIAGIATGLVLAALPAAASLVPAECQGAADPSACGLQSLVNVFVLFANYIFGIAGSLAFVFFIYGGYVWLSSAGSSEKINRGKTIVVNAAIGLVLIFGARGLVTLVVQAVTKGSLLPIENASCSPAAPLPSGSVIKPRWVKDQNDTFQCIASCEDLRTATGKQYECLDKAAEGATDCVTFLCEGSQVCCTKPALAGSQSCTCETPYGNATIPIPAGAGGTCSDMVCTYNDAGHYCQCGSVQLPYNDLAAAQFTENEYSAYCYNIKNCH